MSQGQGSFQTNQRNIPAPAPLPPGPPFALNSANNGLSVDAGGFIVLGDDQFDILEPGKFLRNRKLNLDNHIFNVSNDASGGTDYIRVDPLAGQLVFVAADFLGSNAQIQMLGVTPTTAELALQTILGVAVTDQQKIDLDSAVGRITMARVSSGFVFVNKFLIDFANNIYQFGDVDTEFNGSKLDIDDQAQTVSLLARDGITTNKAELLLIGAAGTELASLFTIVGGKTTSNAIDGVNGIWRAFSNNSNGDYIRMSDFNNRPIEAGTDDGMGGVFKFLLTDITNDVYQFGDIDGNTGGSYIQIFQFGTKRFQYKDHIAVGAGYLDMNPASAVYQIGDLDSTNNGNFAVVEDNASEFQLTNLATNIKVRINGVIGFSGTVTPVTSITVDGGIVTNVT